MAMDLGKMVGPLPLGGWLAVGATGAAITLYSNKQGGAVVVDEYDRDTAIDPGVGEGGSGQWIDLDPPDAPEPISMDNDDWGREAVNYLIARGFDPAISDLAIRKYLGGERLNLQQTALLNKALRHLGSPPYPLPPGPRIPTVPRPPRPRKPTNKPPRRKPPRDRKPNRDRDAKDDKPNKGKGTPPRRKGKRFHVVKPGNTLGGLARKYYGNPKEWTRIYNANRDIIKNPNLIQVGWKLEIP